MQAMRFLVSIANIHLQQAVTVLRRTLQYSTVQLCQCLFSLALRSVAVWAGREKAPYIISIADMDQTQLAG